MGYAESWDWFDSETLRVNVAPSSKVLKFPLRINPVRWVCNIHGRRLYGEFPDDATLPVNFSFRNRDGEGVDDDCVKAAKIVNRVWQESNGADLMIENATISQIVGGCVYRVAWQPWNKRLSYGVRVVKVVPDYFIPVWDLSDPWYTPECWVIQYISGDEAHLKYGVEVNSQPWVMYSEHWTEGSFEIRVNGQVPNGEGFKGANPFGCVPFVYIPHVSRVGGTYGQSHVPGLVGLVEEYNSRMADRGDGVKNAMYDRPVLRNASGKVQVRTLGVDQQLIDIGSAMPGSSAEPDLFYLEPNSVKGAVISKNFTDDLFAGICYDSDTPPILWGFDDVALRSAMSMETLAGPYVSHARAERVQHRTGLSIINQYILKMISVKGTGEVTKAMLDLEPRVQWAKLMPRDRQEKVQEMVQRRTVDPPIASLRNVVTQLAEGEDVNEELALIEQEVEEAQARQQEMQRQQHSLDMETQRQNMEMKLENKRADAKRANPAQTVRQ